MTGSKKLFEPKAETAGEPVTVASPPPSSKEPPVQKITLSTAEKELAVSIAREAVSVALGAYCGALKGQLPNPPAQQALATNAVSVATAVVAALKSANLV